MHISVLQKEVIEYLDPKPNENFVDCTIGEGGHSAAILKKILPRGKLLGIDRDAEILKTVKAKNQNSEIKNNLILICDNYTHLKEIIKKNNFSPVDGILLDLGMSSWHLKKSGRGFAFLKDEPLDMRYEAKCKVPNAKCQNYLTAEEIINKWPKEEIERILKEYGEERFAKRIAENIIKERKLKPIKTTAHLVTIIKKAVPFKYQHGRIHCATRTFQALRIAVNDELNNLKKILPQAIEILKPGGRIVVISFHSLEDRIVKNFLKEEAKKNIITILTKKPIMVSAEEMKKNPRARSAKLRAAIKK